MKATSYKVGQTYTNNSNGMQMTVTGSHRAGSHRGAKTIWHVQITDGAGVTTEMEKDSEQLKRIFWGEKRTYTGQTTGTRVTLTEEARAKKVLGLKQRLDSAINTLKDCHAIDTTTDCGLELLYTLVELRDKRLTEYDEQLKQEAIRAEAEKQEKAKAVKEEKAKKKAALDTLAKLSPEQLDALIAGLK